MPACALTIAASDPSGGAGIEMDLKVFTAHGVYGLTAVTAITVQSSKGLKETHPTDVMVIERILDEIAGDIPVNAVKIGAVAGKRTVKAISRFLEKIPGVPVVLDPVIKASSGRSLVEEGTMEEMTNLLLPRISLLTPNLEEASALSGLTLKDVEGMRRAAEVLAEKGASAVLVKGGHLAGEAKDVFYHEGTFKEWSSPRIQGEFHGTGCALSAAIAARLALGEPLEASVRGARSYLQGLMGSSFEGKGSARILFPGIS